MKTKVTTLYSSLDPVAVETVSTARIDEFAAHAKDVAHILIRDGRFEDLADFHAWLNQIKAAYSVENIP